MNEFQDAMLAATIGQIGNDKTLRDEFASVALIGMISRYGECATNHERLAACSYKLADAMLKERGK